MHPVKRDQDDPEHVGKELIVHTFEGDWIIYYSYHNGWKEISRRRNYYRYRNEWEEVSHQPRLQTQKYRPPLNPAALTAAFKAMLATAAVMALINGYPEIALGIIYILKVIIEREAK